MAARKASAKAPKTIMAAVSSFPINGYGEPTLKYLAYD